MTKQSITPREDESPASHRYQIYRQEKNGCHHTYGNSIDAAEEAVALFLATAPVFESGGLHLWDHREQRAVVSADWNVETTRMGFPVRTRANIFHDDGLVRIAQRIDERERIVASIRMAV